MSHDVPSISPAALGRDLAAGRPVLVVDTRDPAQRAAFPFDAPDPVRLASVPYLRVRDEPVAALAELPPPAAAGRVVAFCASGRSSTTVVRALCAAGYDALNLEGGLRAWSEQVVAHVVPGSDQLGPDSAIVQFRRLGKGCLSYSVVAGGSAVLVDVGRNVEAALDTVAARGARLLRVADTHLHADHVSGGPLAARETGAPYALPAGDASGVKTGFLPVLDGDTWRLDGVEVRAIHTPGHTDGSTSYLVGGRFLLTGDTLFVRGIGRPDLTGQGARLARALHATLTRTIWALDDEVLVLPAHIASTDEVAVGGVAGVRLGTLRHDTLGRLPRNPDEFARAVLAQLPQQPPNFERIRATNRGEPADDPSALEFGPNRCAVTGTV